MERELDEKISKQNLREVVGKMYTMMGKDHRKFAWVVSAIFETIVLVDRHGGKRVMKEFESIMGTQQMTTLRAAEAEGAVIIDPNTD